MRDVPYFPCYASNLIANRHYRTMTLQERGLWISIYLECWPNEGVPNDPKKIAKLFGVTEVEIRSALTDGVMSFFKVNNDLLISQEMEDYRASIVERRRVQSLGGREGARRKKEKLSLVEGKGMGGKTNSTPLGEPEDRPIGVPEGSLGYVSSNQITSNQLINKDVSNASIDKWVNDYDRAPDAMGYRRAKGI